VHTSGWLAGRQPDLLLTASLATATDDQRRILGRALLRQLAGNEPPHDRRYFLLSWQGMGADIEPYLAGDKPVWARREAARMLGDSGCRELDGRLVAVEEIAARHPPGYLGEDVRLAVTMVFALGGCDDPGLLTRLAVVAGRTGRALAVALGRSCRAVGQAPRGQAAAHDRADEPASPGPGVRRRCRNRIVRSRQPRTS
jgi:hypothetical protein